MIVMKFGGTSVANFEAITRTIFIIGGRLDQKPVVVVSALSKITDVLYKIADAAASRNLPETKQLLAQLRTRHVDLAAELLAQSMLKDEAVAKVNELCDSLDSLAMAVCSLGELSERNKAVIISTGEYLSSTIISYAMNAKGIRTRWVDARNMMVTNSSYLKGEPDMNAISARVPGEVSAAYEGMDAIITQGFVGVTADGESTVLGRGGSDYSA
jgi:aspartate kinase